MDANEREGLEAREARRERRLKLAMTILWLAILAAITVGLGVWRGWISDIVLGAVVLAGLAAVALVAGAFVAANSPGPDTRKLDNAGGRRDREQRSRTAQLSVLPATTLILVMVASGNANRLMGGERELTILLPAVVVPLFILLIPMMVMGWDGGARRLRRFLEDELTKEYRARAMTTGFWVLLGSVTAIYLLGLWSPADAVSTLPLALWAGGAAAAFRFAQLHRQAERGLDADA